MCEIKLPKAKDMYDLFEVRDIVRYDEYTETIRIPLGQTQAVSVSQAINIARFRAGKRKEGWYDEWNPTNGYYLNYEAIPANAVDTVKLVSIEGDKNA